MPYQILVLTGLILCYINIILNLLLLKRPLRGAPCPDNPSMVSVLIPARNEQNNIEQCISSVLKQDYPNFEVIVLDDNSEDRTAEIVDKIVKVDGRVRLIHGRPLPGGWAGKCFACHQLSQKAVGQWLLFIDADTVCQTHMIRSTLDIADRGNVALLSGLPQQKVSGLTQKIVIPILFYFLIMSWFPLWLLHASKKPRPTLAIGQFLLFKRDDYIRIGGHEVVKSRIMEDVWFGIEMSRRGGRTLSVDLSSTITTKMYSDLGSMTEGCLKWFYSVAALSPLALIGCVLAAYIFFLAPFYWAYVIPLNSLLSGNIIIDAGMFVVLQIAVIFLMRLTVDWRFRGSKLSFIFHPLGTAFLMLTVFYGLARRALGAGVVWKDRVYQSISHIK